MSNLKRINPGLPLIFIGKLLSWDNSVKSLGENDFYNLSQEFDANVLHLVKQK